MNELDWSKFTSLEDWPQHLRESVLVAHLAALSPEVLATMEKQISHAVLVAWRDAYYRERTRIITRLVAMKHPELKRRGVFQLVGHSLGKSADHVRNVFYAGYPTTQEALND